MEVLRYEKSVGKAYIFRMRLIIVGKESAGKTSLVQSLGKRWTQVQNSPANSASTPGNPSTNVSADYSTVDVTTWNFQRNFAHPKMAKVCCRSSSNFCIAEKPKKETQGNR